MKDIWDLRIAKLRKSIDYMITQQETYGKVHAKCFYTYSNLFSFVEHESL